MTTPEGPKQFHCYVGEKGELFHQIVGVDGQEPQILMMHFEEEVPDLEGSDVEGTEPQQTIPGPPGLVDLEDLVPCRV